MGWTSYNAKFYNSKGQVDRVKECEDILTEKNGPNGSWIPLKVIAVGNTVYAAVRRIKPDGTNYVFAAVVLTSTNMRDYYNFSYKDMDETCGPCECDCPASILKLLSPTDNEYANNWRDRCRLQLQRKRDEAKDPNSLSNLPFGSVIEMPHWDGGTRRITKTKGYSPKVLWISGMYRYTPATIRKQGYTVIERGV